MLLNLSKTRSVKCQAMKLAQKVLIFIALYDFYCSSSHDTVPPMRTYFRRTRGKKGLDAREKMATEDAEISYMRIDLVQDPVEKWIAEVSG